MLGRRAELVSRFAPAFLLAAAGLTGCPTDTPDSEPVDTGATVAVCSDNAWIDVSPGYFRACGVHEDGCIECWGDVKADAVNDTGWTNYGLLEPPAVAARSVSVEASTIDDGEPAACVVASDGHLTCWGLPLVVSIPTAGGVSRIQLRDKYDAAIQALGGAVARYGYDGEMRETVAVDLGPADPGKLWSGEAGYCLIDGDQLRCTGIIGPEESFTRAGVTDASVGAYDACWTDVHGTLSCQALRVSYYPQVLAPPPGAFHSPCVFHMACALNTDDRAVCWYSDELPVPFSGWTEAADVPLAELRCDWWGACGITPDGKLHCWGDDNSVHRPPGSFVIPYGTL